MKFGVITYHKKQLNLSGNEGQNIGDWVQTIAAETLLREWGIDDYVYISRNNARDYDGDYVVLLYNGYNTFVRTTFYKAETFPLPDKITPLFFGFHLHDRVISENVLRQFKEYEPVGCRDEETLFNMREHGIKAYLSGCITALLPRRDKNRGGCSKVILIDAPVGIEEYMPDYLKTDIEYMTHSYRITRNCGEPYMTEEESISSYNKAKKQLEYYRDNAKLVVTGRLHAASPCMAMGIPVVLVAEDFDERFSWIDKFLPLYSKDKWSEIDWNPSAVEYEEVKNKIKLFLKKKLFAIYEEKKEIYEISEFYENRNREDYSSLLKKELMKYRHYNGGKVKYAIWGISLNAIKIKNAVSTVLPKWELTRVFDLKVRHTFEGIVMDSPDNIDENEELVYLVFGKNAQNAAREKLGKINKKYIFIKMNQGEWENNIL